MIRINDNYLKLEDSYLFSLVREKVKEYKSKYPLERVISLGIGDVTLPIVPKIISRLQEAVLEMGDKEMFRGYGPEQGYDFLREKIAYGDYEKFGIDISSDEVFVSDGTKCDLANISEIFSKDCRVAVMDPVYPAFVDVNVIDGRSGDYKDGRYEKIVYLPMSVENGFKLSLPSEKVDIIYLCFPNNPTGVVLEREELKKLVDYAKENGSIILYDAAYCAFALDGVIKSIYEIEGAKEVAIEFRSFSKTAGFTGLRCAYMVIPKELKGVSLDGKEISLAELWKRRQSTRFNGVSYIIQKAVASVYDEETQVQLKSNINYYLENAKIIKEELEKIGFQVFGGVNAPYIWLKIPEKFNNSWEFFDYLLEGAAVVGTPGSGFGPMGEGYFRLTAFGSREDTREAMERIKKLFRE